MRQIFLFISLLILGVGGYFKFFYDVPDAQAAINSFTGFALIIIGFSSLLINLFWKSEKKQKRKEDA